MFELVFRVFYGLFMGPWKRQPVERLYMWVCPICTGGDMYHISTNTYSVLEAMQAIHEEDHRGRS